MAVNVMEYDPTIGLDSFNLDDLLSNSQNDWYQKSFWDSFETFFDNDPQSVVMNNKGMSQNLIPSTELELDCAYLNTSAFLSPVSLSPSSPSQLSDDTYEKSVNLTTNELETDLVDNQSAIEFFKMFLNNSNNSYQDTVDYANNIDQPQSLKSLVNTNKTSKIIGKRSSSEFDSDSSKGKRRKKSIISNESKKERKKFQNKSAANRYRMKKRIEHENVEQEKDVVMKLNEELRQTLEKLQMEYKVVHPLAEAAFSGDSKRKLMLQMIHLRVLKNNVLD